MTRGDKILLAVLLLASLLSAAIVSRRIFFNDGTHASAQCVISVSGVTVHTLQLPAVQTTLAVNGRLGPSTIQVDGRKVRMLQAPCPGHVCVKQGWIKHPGQNIACVPGNILIRIEGTAPLDAVTR